MMMEAATLAGACTAWDATDACCSPSKRGIPGDGWFVQAVVQAALASNAHLDPHRVSLVGIASGGFLALRLACDAPTTFSGILAYAAGSWQAFAAHCPSTTSPVPILSIHGTRDTARLTCLTCLTRGAAVAPHPLP